MHNGPSHVVVKTLLILHPRVVTKLSLVLKVKHEAKLSIQYLETPGVDGFEVMFMSALPFIRTFDQVFQ